MLLNLASLLSKLLFHQMKVAALMDRQDLKELSDYNKSKNLLIISNNTLRLNKILGVCN